jgi:hypothetical protein
MTYKEQSYRRKQARNVHQLPTLLRDNKLSEILESNIAQHFFSVAELSPTSSETWGGVPCKRVPCKRVVHLGSRETIGHMVFMRECKSQSVYFQYKEDYSPYKFCLCGGSTVPAVYGMGRVCYRICTVYDCGAFHSSKVNFLLRPTRLA